MVSKYSLRLLRKQLPKGAVKEIRSRLIAKGLRAYTITYIYYVLDPKDRRENLDILKEAIAIRNEHRKQLTKIESKIKAA